MRGWMCTDPHPVFGISHARITDKLTRENWLQKAVVRQGPTSIYYTYILYAGATPEEGPWMVEVNGNDVNWEYFPRIDDFSREFVDLDDALRYANAEDGSYFAESTFPAERLYWPGERPPESHTVIEFNPRRPKKSEQRSEAQKRRG